MSRDHGDGNEAFSTLDWLARLQKQGNLFEALSTDLKAYLKPWIAPGYNQNFDSTRGCKSMIDRRLIRSPRHAHHDKASHVAHQRLRI